jgi:transcriptional regulator with XRE-family HTH domain
MNIGENIQRIRIAKGLSQVEISQLLGMDNSTYSRIEKKGNKIDFEELLRIGKVLDVTVYELIASEKDNQTVQLENKLSELENALSQSEKEKNLLLTHALGFINEAVENRFCQANYRINGKKMIFEDLVYADLQYIYENELANDYFTFYALKKGLISNPALVNIHQNFMQYIEEQIKNHNKKLGDFIRVQHFLS